MSVSISALLQSAFPALRQDRCSSHFAYPLASFFFSRHVSGSTMASAFVTRHALFSLHLYGYKELFFMLVSQDDAQAYRSQRALLLPPRLRKRKKPDRPRQRRNMLLWSAALALMIMSGLLADWSTIIPTAYAAPTQFLSSTSGHLTAQQYLQNDQPTAKNKGKFQRPTDHKKRTRSMATTHIISRCPAANRRR